MFGMMITTVLSMITLLGGRVGPGIGSVVAAGVGATTEMARSYFMF